MPITAEQNIQVEPKKEVLMVQKGKGFKKVGTGKKKQQKGKQVVAFFPKILISQRWSQIANASIVTRSVIRKEISPST